MNLRPLGYEPNELPDCSTPRQEKPIVTRPPSTVNPQTQRNLAVRRWHRRCICTSDARDALRVACRYAHPGAMANILVVEDNDDVREMMAVSLELEGHEVETAVNGRDALDKLHEGRRPCVILLDLMMPVMNGWEFRNALQRDPELRDVPVVVVSAATGDLVRKTPADAFIPKPIDMDRLLDVVCEFCDGMTKR